MLATLLIAATRALIGAAGRWQGCEPTLAQRIYFANHTSHADTIALWSALPPALRARTRPVAARDYWDKGPLRRAIALNALNAVLVDRDRAGPPGAALEPLAEAIKEGSSLILFPEGTRGDGPLPGPFKSGLFNLAQRFPEVELIPVYLENFHRSLPKGSFFPVPMICTVRFGAPLARINGEEKSAFLARARDAVAGLAQ